MTWPCPGIELGLFNMMLMVEGGVWRIWFYVQHVVSYLKCVLGVCVFVCLGGAVVI